MAPWICDNFVSVVPGVSIEAHLPNSAVESSENTEELTPDDQETTQVSRDRLQDVPEWSKEFTENLVEQEPHPLEVTAKILQHPFVQNHIHSATKCGGIIAADKKILNEER